jgi:uncharacterized protein (TIGR03118 family)
MPRRQVFLAASLFVIISSVLVGLIRASDDNSYKVTVLVSNVPGVAPVTDPKLENAWGIAARGNSPWWVADNGTNFSTLYSGAGVKAGLEVEVVANPTGIVAYSGSQFLLQASPTPRPAFFMFATEAGTILAWNPQFDNLHAHVKFSNGGSIYKGLAISGDTLYATDFGECKVQALNGTFSPFDTTGGFEDASIPDDYCPFGIQAIGASIFVTYALRGGLDDIAGVSHGFVREFDTNGNLIAKVASHGTLNSPWGLAMASPNFGAFSGCLLVGNFGDGLINAYCVDKQGEFRPRGRLRDDHGEIRIDGLWAIGFGIGTGSGSPNVLYFAAGPDDEVNGAFGKVEFVQ